MKQSILSQQIPAAYRLDWKVTGDCFEYKVLFSTQVGYGFPQSASWNQIAKFMIYSHYFAYLFPSPI